MIRSELIGQAAGSFHRYRIMRRIGVRTELGGDTERIAAKSEYLGCQLPHGSMELSVDQVAAALTESVMSILFDKSIQLIIDMPPQHHLFGLRSFGKRRNNGSDLVRVEQLQFVYELLSIPVLVMDTLPVIMDREGEFGIPSVRMSWTDRLFSRKA